MKKHFSDKFKGRSGAGFTLMEVLIAVAILAILLTIGTTGFLSIRKNYAQSTLDGKAQLLYVAAQNRLTQLVATGQTELYDAEGISQVVDGSQTLRSVVKGASGSYAESFLPQSCVDDEIWNNQWAIEYDASTGTVISVYYAEGSESLGYSASSRAALITKAAAKNGEIGYCHGENSSAASDQTLETLSPAIQIQNGNVLKATVICPKPTNAANLSFKITVYDKGNDPSGYPVVTVDSVDLKYNNISNTYSYTLVLDELTADGKQRFGKNYSACTPGKDIVIRAEVISDSKSVDGYTVTAETNSLFDSIKTGADGKITAYISCGRHLQNLDKDTVKIAVTNGVQTCDIDWSSEYPAISFVPIDNSDLKTYSGEISSTESAGIYHLTTADTTAPGGLFGKFYGTSVKCLNLCGTKVNAGANPAGALVGSYNGTGTLTVSKCRVYLDEEELKLAGATADTVFVGSSDSAGGLIGKIASGTVNIENCYASTVVGNASTANAGGFVGSNAGALTITKSYADCYSKGKNAAGFVGSGNVRTVSLSYCAGYVTSSVKGAGMSVGTIANASNSYTLVCFRGCSGSTYGISTGVGSISNLYYWQSGSVSNSGTQLNINNKATMESTLFGVANSPFRSISTQYSVAYGLLGKKVLKYYFPILEGMPHYGDWEANWASWVLSPKSLSHDILAEGNSRSVNLKCSADCVVASSNTNVATVNTPYSALQSLNADGTPNVNTYRPVTFTIKDKGSSTLTATVGEAKDSFTLTVTAVISASANKTSFEIMKGKTEGVTFTAKNKNGTAFSSADGLDWDFSYSTGNAMVKKNSSGGYYIEGINVGSETITVKAKVTKYGKTFYSDPITLTVTVRPAILTVTYLGGVDEYFTATPLTATYGQKYVGTVTFNKDVEPDGDPDVVVGDDTLDGDTEDERGYTWKKTGGSKLSGYVYTLTIDADRVTDDIEVIVYNNMMNQVRVSYISKYITETYKSFGKTKTREVKIHGAYRSRFYAIMDPTLLFSEGNAVIARKYAIRGANYVSYVAVDKEYFGENINIVVIQDGVTLVEDVDYRYSLNYRASPKTTADVYKLIIYGKSITGDLLQIKVINK